jgi:NitT/TauT family transport system substrate-binding protein
MPTVKNPSRRKLFRASGAALGLAAVPFVRSANAQSKLRPVSMRLDWLYNGPNVGFIAAREKGYYREAGLDVEVGAGKGSGSTAQLVATKGTQFGFADGYVCANSVAKGLDVHMIAAVFRRNPTAVVVLEESSIKTPKDLEGKTVAIPTGATQYQQWPAFVKGCKLDASKLQLVNVDAAGSPPALITGKVQAIAGYAQGYVPSVEIRGKKKARVLWYADCGVNAVSNGIIVHPDLLKETQLIKDFVAASLRGFLYARAHPEEAALINKKYAETTDPAVTRREMEMSWNTWVTPSTRGRPLGWMSEEDWQSTLQVLREYGGVANPPGANRLYTNAFVPTGKEFIPPQPHA